MKTAEQLTKNIKFAVKTTFPLRKQMTGEVGYNLLTTSNILGIKYKAYIVNDDNGEELFAIKCENIRGYIYFEYFYQMEAWLFDTEFQQSVQDIKNEILKQI